MSTSTLHYLNNQFENGTVGSRKRMNILLTDHVAKLNARQSGLLGELGELLGSDDPLWYAFGFSRPSDPEQPQQPENLTLVAGAAESGMVFADWDDARRAERYRVFVLDVTVNAGAVEVVSNVTESEFAITEQVSGHTIEVWTIAVNDAGDSPESGHQSIPVP